MTRQMAAERNRRAMVTEADGQREAAVAVAQGERQATILRAEGEKQAAILGAEGDRQGAILRAEGFSLALDKIAQVAQGVDSKTLTLQYMDALKELGASASTKFVIPIELVNLIRPLVAQTAQAYAEPAADE
jgi:regulator of protease activity HflC (stomatin/prohibitin superfamily)